MIAERDRVVLCHKRPPLLEKEGFTHFITFPPTINDFMKKPEEVGQINPESTIEATSVNPTIDEGIVALHQHKPLALEALHTCPVLSELPNAIHDERDASSEQAATHERRAKVHQDIGVPSRLSPFPQIPNPTLHHQDGKGQ
jgi:hypothetical protein